MTKTTAGLPVETLDVPLLVDAARFALSRVTVSPQQLSAHLLVDPYTALWLLDDLARWRVVSVARGGSSARQVLIIPAHETTVVSAITRHAGIPPTPNPLEPLTHPGLTVQHRAVLDHLAEGDSNREIATALHLSRDTVRTHVAHLCERLSARNRTHLVTVAHTHGLLPNPHLMSEKDERE
ncbi:helix-turn-helix transcriptional regulator [Actinocrispum wychmicini]|uniref:Regulatory LuxR family protein n=1 Tax=Actinocrispum wychmicini TaxID=1213861 RepID=A0A4R2JDZ0_9PSEU|nr:LuxR C-terminal-related transcriptional regulator [Actinocrispum wychmicini]TCO57184.1 regulatory LuxR family protein [Actinocrispum wychmicini]